MLKVLILSILLIFSSCDETLDVGSSGGVHYGKKVYSEIERVINVPWKVGLKREARVSQGLRFFTSIPRFSKKAQETLASHYGVNSWIFRFTRVRRGKATKLRYFHLNFVNITRNTKNISVSLFYQAAAVSKKFRFFHCPAFGHRFEISSHEVKERPQAGAKDLYVRSVEKIRAKVTRFKFSPMVLPAGRSLLGDYYVDMAFYNSSSKQRFSNWHPINGIIRVSQENTKIISSCAGIKEELIPLPQSRVPDIRDFEIK